MLINFEQLPIPKKIDFEPWCTLQHGVLSQSWCYWVHHALNALRLTGRMKHIILLNYSNSQKINNRF